MRHDPRWQYDCGRCKFSWNCGPACDCVLKELRDPPPKRRVEVDQALRDWRNSKPLTDFDIERIMED